MKYIPENNAKKIREVLETCKELGGVIFQLFDSDGHLGTYRNVEMFWKRWTAEMIALPFGLWTKERENWGILAFFLMNPSPKTLSWIIQTTLLQGGFQDDKIYAYNLEPDNCIYVVIWRILE